MNRTTKSKFSKLIDDTTVNIILPTNCESPFEVKFLNSNRVPKKHDIEKIKISIEQTNALHIKPIIAHYNEDNNTLYLIDGQHRYEAAKIIGVPVHVKVTEDYDPLWMSVLNCNQKNWTLRNFADMWSKEGPQARTYQIFIEYLERYDITAGLLVALFQDETDRDTKDGGNREFKTGQLTNQHLTKVQTRLSQLESVKHVAANPPIEQRTFKKQQFQQAMLKALATKDFNLDKFLNNLYCAKHAFNKLARQSDMLVEIFRILRKRGK